MRAENRMYETCLKCYTEKPTIDLSHEIVSGDTMIISDQVRSGNTSRLGDVSQLGID
jgi:hypothetical protein